eukprot:COSAG02_NODE_3845_length_6153_cov_3.206640_6_plen_490_part_00
MAVCVHSISRTPRSRQSTIRFCVAYQALCRVRPASSCSARELAVSSDELTRRGWLSNSVDVPVTEWHMHKFKVSRGERTRSEPDRSGEIEALEDENRRLRLREQQMREQQIGFQKPLLLVLRMAGDQEMMRLVNFDRKGGDGEQQTFLQEELHEYHGYRKEDFAKHAQTARTFVQHNNEKYEHLHLCDIVAVRIYTEATVHTPFNAAMRAMTTAHKPPREWQAMYYHMLAGTQHLEGADPQKDTYLYRVEDQLHKKYERGDIVTWMAFTSTSYVEESARTFLKRDHNGIVRDQVLFRIANVPANIGACLSAPRCSADESESLSVFKGDESEHEILLPAGVSVRVVHEKDSDEFGTWLVDLEYVGFNVDSEALTNPATMEQKVHDVESELERKRDLEWNFCPECGGRMGPGMATDGPLLTPAGRPCSWCNTVTTPECPVSIEEVQDDGTIAIHTELVGSVHTRSRWSPSIARSPVLHRSASPTRRSTLVL